MGDVIVSFFAWFEFILWIPLKSSVRHDTSMPSPGFIVDLCCCFLEENDLGIFFAIIKHCFFIGDHFVWSWFIKSLIGMSPLACMF